MQNDVVYVPVTTDGTLVSYRDQDALDLVADRRAWLLRIADQEIDWVAAIGPPTVEHQWLADLPGVFPLEINMGQGRFLLTRVNHEALGRYLASPAAR